MDTMAAPSLSESSQGQFLLIIFFFKYCLNFPLIFNAE